MMEYAAEVVEWVANLDATAAQLQAASPCKKSG
jgi:hypothetical protein